MDSISLPNDVEKCSQVLSAVLDYEFERFKGGIVFDGWDPYIEAHKKIHAKVAKLQKGSDLHKLKQTLEARISRYRGNAKFVEYISNRTGYKIEVLPNVHESQTYVRDVAVQTSGEGHLSSTYVTIELKGGSGPIYGIQGHHPELKAYWRNNHTVVIETPRERKESLRYKQVSSFGETVDIVYLEK